MGDGLQGELMRANVAEALRRSRAGHGHRIGRRPVGLMMRFGRRSAPPSVELSALEREARAQVDRARERERAAVDARRRAEARVEELEARLVIAGGRLGSAREDLARMDELERRYQALLVDVATFLRAVRDAPEVRAAQAYAAVREALVAAGAPSDGV